MEIGNPSSIQALEKRMCLSQELFGVIIRSGMLILQLQSALKEKTDCYDLVKDYVDLCQSSAFAELEELAFESPNSLLNQLVLESLKMERWVVLLVFYFSLETDKLKLVRPELEKMVMKLSESFFCVFQSVRYEDEEYFSEVKQQIEETAAQFGLDIKFLRISKEAILKKNLEELRRLYINWYVVFLILAAL